MANTGDGLDTPPSSEHPAGLTPEQLRRLAIVNERLFGGCGDVNPVIANSRARARPAQFQILVGSTNTTRPA